MNSNIFKLDAGMVQLLLNARVGAVLIAAFPPVIAFIATNPVLGLAVVAIATSVIQSLVCSGFKDGVEIHYNFFLFEITVIRE